MERLTGNYEPCAPGTNGCAFDECAYTKMIARLAAYEDTGLTPERCAELAQSEKDGRLVVLPCKVGDTVYFIKRRWDFVEERYDPPEVDEQKVECFIVGERGISGPKKWDYEGPESICGDNGQWYLTRAEAEAALDKQKGD